MDRSSRRDFLKKSALATAAVGSASIASAFDSPIAEKHSVPAKRVLRIAHLTDVHITNKKGAEEGFAKALQYVNNLSDKPDFIFNGGDSIMDALHEAKDKVKLYWTLWHTLLKENNQLPIYHCIGNHDVYGWSMISASKKDPLYGKLWAIDEFGLENRYYSFDKNGWHFIVLDSTHEKKGLGYTAKLDDEQFEWLTADLAETNSSTPVCVLSHIPIIASCVFFDGDNMKKSEWRVPGSWMHTDARKIKDLFYQHKNVKLALSGHIHLHDAVSYLNVKYLCNGAVSGAWWGGNYHEFPPALVLIDLYEDGHSEHEFVAYESFSDK